MPKDSHHVEAIALTVEHIEECRDAAEKEILMPSLKVKKWAGIAGAAPYSAAGQ